MRRLNINNFYDIDYKRFFNPYSLFYTDNLSNFFNMHDHIFQTTNTRPSEQKRAAKKSGNLWGW